jgi:hypothetical protein
MINRLMSKFKSPPLDLTYPYSLILWRALSREIDPVPELPAASEEVLWPISFPSGMHHCE